MYKHLVSFQHPCSCELRLRFKRECEVVFLDGAIFTRHPTLSTSPLVGSHPDGGGRMNGAENDGWPAV